MFEIGLGCRNFESSRRKRNFRGLKLGWVVETLKVLEEREILEA